RDGVDGAQNQPLAELHTARREGPAAGAVNRAVAHPRVRVCGAAVFQERREGAAIWRGEGGGAAGVAVKAGIVAVLIAVVILRRRQIVPGRPARTGAVESAGAVGGRIRADAGHAGVERQLDAIDVRAAARQRDSAHTTRVAGREIHLLV